jgi:Response regulator containing CheY-like receiver domain and AraC-type DNA-binding domain
MIADDEENVCRLIRSLIDWSSLEMEIVGTAHNGVEALEMIRSLSPDVMITDIRMPGCDGLEMIRRARNVNEQLDFIIISGYRHFEYAQNAIRYGVGDYLLKPIKKEDLLDALGKMRTRYIQRTQRISSEEQMKEQIKSDADKLRRNLFTEQLLKKGGEPEQLTVESVNRTYHYDFQPGLFQVCAAKVDCGYDDRYNSAVQILAEKVSKFFYQFLQGCCFDMGVYPEDGTVYCILNYDMERQKELRRQLKAVLYELVLQKAAFEQFEFTLGVGTAGSEVGGLRELFQSADYAAGQRILLGTGRLIEDGAVRSSPQVMEFLLAELNKTMGTALELLDKPAVLNAVRRLQEQAGFQKLSGLEVYSIAEQICSMYLTHLRNNQVSIHHGDEFFEKFRIHAGRCGTKAELFRYLALMIGESLDLIIEDKKQTATRPIRLAKQYIQQNYSKPISLEEVSGVAGFNASYFSTLFKKESGVSFMDYLAEIRMNRAKELLRETSLSVAAVCEQVGYSDLKYFAKNFRKTTGVKPNEYRKLYS